MSTLSLSEPNLADAEAACQLSALLGGAGVAALDETGWIRVTGEDRVRWLNGMTTNSIVALKPGEGNYNFFLSAQGRIQGDAYAFATENSILLETAAGRVAGLIELLDRFIIMDDVELADLRAERAGVVVAGPEAAAVLRAAGIETGGLEPLGFRVAEWNGERVTVMHAYSPLVPRFEVWAEGGGAAGTLAAIAARLGEAGAVSCGDEVLEHLRILEGTPRFRVDIRDRELPQETNQTRALHFSKGCYLGQEIVERIRSRGNVHRTFQAFRLNGDLPGAGAALEVDGKAVGELTSVAAVPLATGPVQLALGYIRREAMDRLLPIRYAGGWAVPVALPYLPALQQQFERVQHA